MPNRRKAVDGFNHCLLLSQLPTLQHATKTLQSIGKWTNTSTSKRPIKLAFISPRAVKRFHLNRSLHETILSRYYKGQSNQCFEKAVAIKLLQSGVVWAVGPPPENTVVATRWHSEASEAEPTCLPRWRQICSLLFLLRRWPGYLTVWQGVSWPINHPSSLTYLLSLLSLLISDPPSCSIITNYHKY